MCITCSTTKSPELTHVRDVDAGKIDSFKKNLCHLILCRLVNGNCLSGGGFVRNSPSATIPDCNHVKSIIISPVDDLEDKHDVQSLIQLKETVKNKVLYFL